MKKIPVIVNTRGRFPVIPQAGTGLNGANQPVVRSTIPVIRNPHARESKPVKR